MKTIKHLMIILGSLVFMISNVNAEEKNITYQVYEKGDIVCRSEATNKTHTCRNDSYETKYIVEIDDDTKNNETIELKLEDGTTEIFDKKDLALAKLSKSDNEYVFSEDEEKNVTEYIYYKSVEEALLDADEYDHVVSLEQLAVEVKIKAKVTLDVEPSAWMYSKVENNGTIVLHGTEIWVENLSGNGSIVYIDTKEVNGNKPRIALAGNINTTDFTFKFHDINLDEYIVMFVYPLSDNATEEEKIRLVSEVNEKMKKMIEKSISGYTTKYIMHEEETASAWAEIRIIKKVNGEQKESSTVATTTQKQETNPKTSDVNSNLVLIILAGSIALAIVAKKRIKKLSK